MLETIVLITVAILSAVAGYQFYKLQALKEWEEDSLNRMKQSNHMKGWAYNIGFRDGFNANEDDVDPDEE